MSGRDNSPAKGLHGAFDIKKGFETELVKVIAASEVIEIKNIVASKPLRNNIIDISQINHHEPFLIPQCSKYRFYLNTSLRRPPNIQCQFSVI